MKILKNMEILFLLSVLTVLLAAKAENYCSKSLCQPGVQHIACGHSGRFAPRCPSNAHLVKLSPANIEQVVYLHNEKRNEIAGGGLQRYRPAARMAAMQWDNELASLAVYNVMQCEMKHDACHNTDTFKHSGQNLYKMWYYGQSPTDEELIKDAINSWYEEHKDANMRFIDQFPRQYSGPAIGHFTEMVNDNNTHLGCAASRWSEDGSEYFLFACNYAVTNFLDRPIYKSSPEPATECARRNPVFQNLCSIGEFNANVNSKNSGTYTPQTPNRYPNGNPGNPSTNMPQCPNTNPTGNRRRFPPRRLPTNRWRYPRIYTARY